ncbi:MAG: hypothetical protein JRI46_11180 [Deltaproteobacteria bacterium]|nr:hypothetical protein [Deltaproteobacteria bacterium]
MRKWLGFYEEIIRFLLAYLTVKIYGIKKRWIMFQPSIPPFDPTSGGFAP